MKNQATMETNNNKTNEKKYENIYKNYREFTNFKAKTKENKRRKKKQKQKHENKERKK